MAVLLALVSSALYGSGDFFGGLASRRAPALRVTTVAQLAGLVPLAVAVAAWGHVTVRPADIVWGIAGGAAGGAALVTFYRALARGPMAVVAPVTGVVGAAVPALTGLALGDDIAWLVGSGLVLGVVAIAFVSFTGRSERDQAASRPIVLAAVAAGLGFGVFFVCFGRTSTAAGMWPLVGARIGSLSTLGALLVATREPLSVDRSALPATIVAGVFDVSANGTLLWAITRGETSVIGVLSSLYPAATVMLARAVLREQLVRIQVIGLVLAAIAVALVAIGHA